MKNENNEVIIINYYKLFLSGKKILDITELNHRLDFVEFFTQNPEILRDVRYLKK